MAYDYNNKVAVVTGGSKGIGFEIAKNLAKKNSIVYLIARTEETLISATNKINELYPSRAKYKIIDITNLEQIESTLDDIYNEEQRLDIFVNNAGEFVPHTIGNRAANIEKIYNLNFFSPLKIVDYLISKFNNKSELKILTINSQSALKVLEGNQMYGSSKLALNYAMDNLELDLGKESNIKFYHLYPGTVFTPGVKQALEKGYIQNPIPIEEVSSSALDLLADEYKEKKMFIGFKGGHIVRELIRNFNSEETEYHIGIVENSEIRVENFNPEEMFGYKIEK